MGGRLLDPQKKRVSFPHKRGFLWGHDAPSVNLVVKALRQVCDLADNDCNGDVDEGVGTTWYADADSDGHGDGASPTVACSPPTGHVANSDDCDDTDATAHPGGTEICDGVDNNCRNGVDEGVSTPYYADGDSDGYGDVTNPINACSPLGVRLRRHRLR